METLPDYLRQDLHFISIGLNPSPVSVEAGYYFSNPRDRFWKALNRSRLANAELQPGKAALQELFNKFNIGFTHLIKRPTMGNELRITDYREGVATLKDKLMKYQPSIAWFHGKGTYKNYLRYAEQKDTVITWGAQKNLVGKTHVFVTPNPTQASVEDLIKLYDEMVSYRIRELFGLGTN